MKDNIIENVINFFKNPALLKPGFQFEVPHQPISEFSNSFIGHLVLKIQPAEQTKLDGRHYSINKEK